MRIAIETLCYNDEKNLKACIKNWRGVVDKHLVLVSEKPWHGPTYERDKSYEIALEMGADAVLGRWQSESEQRNWGLARLYDYDWVLIIDSDEFFTKDDQKILLKRLNQKDSWFPVAYPKNIIVYWKTPEYILFPTDVARFILVVDPKSVLFTFARNANYINGDGNTKDCITYIDITSHHFSYVRTDEQILQKLTSYEHADTINDLTSWYVNVWSKWEPGSNMIVRPQGIEQSKAVYSPAPKEIIELFENS